MDIDRQESYGFQSDHEFLDQIIGYVQIQGDNIQQMQDMNTQNSFLQIPAEQQFINKAQIDKQFSTLFKQEYKYMDQEEDCQNDHENSSEDICNKGSEDICNKGSSEDLSNKSSQDKQHICPVSDGLDFQGETTYKKPRQRKATQKRYRDRKKEQKNVIETEIGDLQEKVENMRLLNTVFVEESQQLKSLMNQTQQQQAEFQQKNNYGKMIFWIRISKDPDGNQLTEEKLKNMNATDWNAIYVRWVLYFQEVTSKIEKQKGSNQQLNKDLEDAILNLTFTVVRLSIINPEIALIRDTQVIINPNSQDNGNDSYGISYKDLKEANNLMEQIQISKAQKLKLFFIQKKHLEEQSQRIQVCNEAIDQTNKFAKHAMELHKRGERDICSHNFQIEDKSFQKQILSTMQSTIRFGQIYQEMVFSFENLVIEVCRIVGYRNIAKCYIMSCPQQPLLRTLIALIKQQGQEIVSQLGLQDKLYNEKSMDCTMFQLENCLV